jgi:exonuclease VII large subunit
MPYNPDVGAELLTPTDIMAELEAKVGKNAKNRAIRQNAEQARQTIATQQARVANKAEAVEDLRRRLAEAEKAHRQAIADLDQMQLDYQTAQAAAAALQDEDTEALKTRLAQIESTNAEVRKNLEREKALAQAEGYADEYRALAGQIQSNQEEMRGLLDGATMPHPDLTVDNGALTYKGRAWDCMSGAEQLRIATSIARKVNPGCGFVLLDGLEKMDMKTLQEFGAWLQAEGLQVLATKVSTGPECSIIIEDGKVLATAGLSFA